MVVYDQITFFYFARFRFSLFDFLGWKKPGKSWGKAKLDRKRKNTRENVAIVCRECQKIAEKYHKIWSETFKDLDFLLEKKLFYKNQLTYLYDMEMQIEK